MLISDFWSEMIDKEEILRRKSSPSILVADVSPNEI